VIHVLAGACTFATLRNDNQHPMQISFRIRNFIATPSRLGLRFGFLLVALTLRAQTLESWRGQVVDEQGSVIAGAEITLIAADGKATTAITDTRGEFSFHNVASGKYTVVVTASSFQPFRQNEVVVTATPFKAILLIAPLSEEQQIVAEVSGTSIEPDQNLSATILEGQALQDLLPETEEEMREFLEQLAGPAAGGATGGQGGAQIRVNGFRGGRLPPKEAIASVRVNANPFSPEYAQSGAARVEIITKPGNDQWHGGSSWTVRNSALDARNAFARVKPAVAQNRYSFNLSGPLMRKRLSFFANTDYRKLTGSSNVVATTLDGPFNANVVAPNSNRGFDMRTDYLLSKRNTLNVNYTYGQSRAFNREFAVRLDSGAPSTRINPATGRVVGNYTLPERGSDSNNQNHTLRIAETFIVNARLLMETRLQLEHGRNSATATTGGVAINVLDAFFGGGATCCPSRTVTSGGEWQQYLTWSRKTHTLRGGWQQEYDRVNDTSANNFNGTFTFANLDQYRLALAGQGRAQQFSLNRGNPQLNYALWRSAWFFNDDWRLHNRVTLSFGLRHEFQTQLSDANNFAPRLGLAWSPSKNRRTVVRAGGGLFYHRLLGNLYENTLRYNGVTQQSIVIPNAQFPDPFAGTPTIQTRNTVRRTLDDSLRAPYTISFSGSLERQLPLGLTTSTTYTFSRGLHQFRTRNVNAPLRDGTNTIFPFGAVTGALYQIESSASSRHHGILTRMDRRFGRSLMILGNYSLSWTHSDADNASALPANGYDLRSEWSRAFTDRRHSVFISGRVRLLYDWMLAPTLTASSGVPFNITSGFDENDDTAFTDRPAGLRRNSDLPASFYAQLTNGNRCVQNCQPGGQPVTLLQFLRRNFPDGVSAQGPGAFNVSARLSKTFGFGTRAVSAADRANRRANQTDTTRNRAVDRAARQAERGKTTATPANNANIEAKRFNLTFSVQVSNLLNRVNFGAFGGVLGSPYFAAPSSAGGARSFEWSMRFSF
jgi:hypothetical protein